MKKILKTAVSVLLFCGISASHNPIQSVDNNLLEQESITVLQNFDVTLPLSAKSSYLMEYSTKTAFYANNETERLPIASMCKIMTLILSFEAVDNGVIQMDEELCVSEKAASMGGSQVFLEANAKYPVKELIKSIVVCSANDSCVAMAEKIAGSEELFVDKMNEKAIALGATNTLFANCTGLPKEPQYSCAKDVAIMLKELLSHEEYYEFGKVWMDKFQHPEGRYTEITNTNKLIRFYDGCDGGKTGFTNEAGFCLAATAMRNNMRVIAVVIGEESSDKRFKDIRTAFDYAFAAYEAVPIVEKGVPIEKEVKVNVGKEKSVAVCPEKSVYVVQKKGKCEDCVTEIKTKKVFAPVKKGTKLGEIIVYRNGVACERVPLLAANDVKRATFGDIFKDIAKAWNN